MSDPTQSEATKLEELWAGEFGSAYIDRNRHLDERRVRLWDRILGAQAIRSVLEIGCGQGGNLRLISRILEPADIWGIEVNARAREIARAGAPGANVVAGVARALPFRDSFVDLAFTVGVLIHQPESTLPLVMGEVVRCARSFVLWVEYHAPATEEIPYHGVPGTLYKRDYGAIYHELFPELTVRDEGFLDEEDGFDRATWQLLEKPGRRPDTPAPR